MLRAKILKCSDLPKPYGSPVFWNVENGARKGRFTYFCTLPEQDQTFPRYLPIHRKLELAGIQKGYIKALSQSPTGINLSSPVPEPSQGKGKTPPGYKQA